MSERVGNIVILEGEPEAICQLCGKLAELRPYGPRGERVCFECAMKDKKSARRQMRRILYGENIQ